MRSIWPCGMGDIEGARELTTHPYGIRDFVIKDPDGHLIGIGEKVHS